MILWALALGLLWSALQGDPHPANLIGGTLLAYLVLLWMQPLFSHHPPTRWRLRGSLRLIFFFTKELLISNVRVMAECLRPTPRLRPTLIDFPLQITSDTGIATFANLCTLTPGTLSVEVSADRQTLKIHVLLDGEDALPSLRQLEQKVQEAIA